MFNTHPVKQEFVNTYGRHVITSHEKKKYIYHKNKKCKLNVLNTEDLINNK